jgi:hypothetical protein
MVTTAAAVRELNASLPAVWASRSGVTRRPTRRSRLALVGPLRGHVRNRMSGRTALPA